jgi:hypothetical protein
MQQRKRAYCVSLWYNDELWLSVRAEDDPFALAKNYLMGTSSSAIVISGVKLHKNRIMFFNACLLNSICIGLE